MKPNTPAAPPATPLQVALSHYQNGRYPAAREIVVRVCKKQPRNPVAWQMAGAVARKMGDRPAAEDAWTRSLSLNPSSTEVRFNLASLHQELGRLPMAVAMYREILRQDPKHFYALNNLGVALERMSHLEEALDCQDRALAIQADYHKAHHNRAVALHALARTDEAMRALDQALTLSPGNAHYLRTATTMKRITQSDPHLTVLERLAPGVQALPTADQIHLHFALGKAYSDTGNRVRAFDHWLKGNALKRSEIAYNEPETLAYLAQMAAAFGPDVLASAGKSGNPSSAPVFIVGMPRSGSTLVEQILATHPQVLGGGERDALRQLINTLAAPGAGLPSPQLLAGLPDKTLEQLGSAYVAGMPPRSATQTLLTDKMPRNFLYVGLIRLILPNAKIIHTRRNAVDTCLSCFSQMLDGDVPFIYDLAELGRYWRAYDRLMAHWRALLPSDVFLEVAYEDLIHDAEGQARRLIQHCGLPWLPQCLEFHSNPRAVRTASAAQVRTPLYRDSVDRASGYGDLLAPLHQALSESQVGSASP